MNAVGIIARKQAGGELTQEEIREIILGYSSGEVPDYQMSAFLMAVYFQGMSNRETADLIQVMIASGRKIDLSSILGIKVDKHSTGGVGDKVSLVVAPLVASLGVPVPMISGRGLGHTGGTLDKLESIPGFTTALSSDDFVAQIRDIGCALIGQTEEIVPADRRLYALRDVTATVKSLPLITSSIISKKVAEGAQALLLDVKFGRGAIYSDVNEARTLAQRLVEVSAEAGLETVALLTDMDQPLGRAVGNWLEVLECIHLMKGVEEDPNLKELCLVQAAIMLQLGQKAKDYSEARVKAVSALQSGRAFEKFLEIAKSQRADIRFLEDPSLYTSAACSRVIEAPTEGFIQKVDALIIGQAAVRLGAGRLRKEDSVDPTAGIVLHAQRGDFTEKRKPLATIYAASETLIEAVLKSLASAFQISEEPPLPRPLILSRITCRGEEPWTY